ncbi:ATP-binding cassette domain-containing protein, partial [Nonomuraea sp. NPDC046570]|uniref:ATP-binding cassette domain-containing protein n=1 Tax=Nonomuraea sp. NPDC046570 TaxID=3155255 RepID=UPI0033E1BADD
DDDPAGGARWRPPGSEPIYAGQLASLLQFTEPRANHTLTGDEALAALTLLGALRDWLTDAEPDLIDAARRAASPRRSSWSIPSIWLRTGDEAVNGLSVRDLRVRVGSGRAAMTVVDGITLDLPPGGALGLVGESGSGKSTCARAIVCVT